MEVIQTLLVSHSTEILGILLVGCLSIGLLWLKWKVSNFLKRTVLQNQIENDMSIRDALASVRTQLNADRSYVYMFHNGEYYTNGNSILKMSCTHESSRAGVTKEGDQAQGILVSTVSEAVEGLVESSKYEDHVTSTQINDLPSCFYRSAMEAQGVTAVAKYPLYKDNNIIGFVGVDYIHEEVDSDKLHFLQECAPRLEFLVNRTSTGSFWTLMKRIH
jgi:hypothetical protein